MLEVPTANAYVAIRISFDGLRSTPVGDFAGFVGGRRSADVRSADGLRCSAA
jgi:hypothetical protein